MTQAPTFAIADDHPLFRDALKGAIAPVYPDATILEAGNMDEAAARANPFFEGRVAHGYFIVSAAAGLFVDPAPGPVLANYGLENLRFLMPLSPGDEIQVQFTCKQIIPRETEDYGEVRWDTRVMNQRGELVATYDVLTLVAKQR